MKKAPLLYMVALFVVGILLGRVFSTPSTPLFLVSGILLLFLALFTHHSDIALISLGFFCIFLGFARLRLFDEFLFDRRLKTLPTYAPIKVQGHVASEPRLDGSTLRFDLEMHALEHNGEWKRARGKLRIRARADSAAIQVADELLAKGQLVWPLPSRNPGEFNYRNYLHAHGIQALLYVREGGFLTKLRELNLQDAYSAYWHWAAKRRLAGMIRQIFDPVSERILKGLLLGDRSDITKETRESFSRTGIVHVLAVSGLHVGFILLIFTWMSRPLRRFPAAQVALTLAAVWTYAWLTGLQPPVARASVMASLYLIGRYRDRPMKSANFLAAAAFLILIWNPLELFQAGFQLSFAAVAAILFFYPKILQQIQRYRAVQSLNRIPFGFPAVELICVSLAAQLGTLPITAYYFGRVSLAGVFANLLVVPAIFLAVAAAFVSLVLYLLWPHLAGIAGEVASGIIHFVLWFSGVVARQPWASIEHWYPAPDQVLFLAALIVLLFYWKHPALRYGIILMLLVGANLTVWIRMLAPSRSLEVYFLSVGQGDAAVIKFPTEQTLLIDGGPAYDDFDAGADIIVPFLHRQKIRKLDLVILTHPHSDHLGGLEAVMGEMPVAAFVAADSVYHSAAFVRLSDLVQRTHIPFRVVQRGNVLRDFSPALLYVLGPSPQVARTHRSLNESSLVVKLQYGKTAFLFTGDTEKDGEAALLPYGEFLRAGVIKAGHHGSETSSTMPFIAEVRPAWAAISVGLFNRFEHPSERILERFADLGCTPIRTDLNGAAVFRSDGERIHRLR